jgi:hypothetical protein
MAWRWARWLLGIVALACGCTEAHSIGDAGIGDAGPAPHDALVVMRDAPGPTDAAIADDALSEPDAWTGACPTYAHDVQPIYQLHCATCHTTGRAIHFASSYVIAAQASSACSRTTSMATCTLQLGRPGGTMARNDRLGGFTPSEIAILQAWIACGVPN